MARVRYLCWRLKNIPVSFDLKPPLVGPFGLFSIFEIIHCVMSERELTHTKFMILLDVAKILLLAATA